MEMIIFLALSNGFRASLRPNSSSKNPRPKKSRALKQKTHSAGEWVESFCFEIRLQKRPPPPGWIPGKSIPAIPVGEIRVHEGHSVIRLPPGFNSFFSHHFSRCQAKLRRILKPRGPILLTF
jgi:hypothetical protein